MWHSRYDKYMEYYVWLKFTTVEELAIKTPDSWQHSPWQITFLTHCTVRSVISLWNDITEVITKYIDKVSRVKCCDVAMSLFCNNPYILTTNLFPALTDIIPGFYCPKKSYFLYFQILFLVAVMLVVCLKKVSSSYPFQILGSPLC